MSQPRLRDAPFRMVSVEPLTTVRGEVVGVGVAASASTALLAGGKQT